MKKTNIRQQLRRTFSALAVSGALLTFPSADAAPPVAVSGSFTACDVVTDVRWAGPNQIISLSPTIEFTGDFNGTWVGTEQDVIFPDGSGTFHSSGIFTGCVNSSCGTIVMTFEGNFFNGGGRFLVNWVAEQGTAGLARLHGDGTVSDFAFIDPPGGCDDAFTANYSGQIQFAP